MLVCAITIIVFANMLFPGPLVIVYKSLHADAVKLNSISYLVLNPHMDTKKINLIITPDGYELKKFPSSLLTPRATALTISTEEQKYSELTYSINPYSSRVVNIITNITNKDRIYKDMVSCLTIFSSQYSFLILGLIFTIFPVATISTCVGTLFRIKGFIRQGEEIKKGKWIKINNE